MLKYLFTAYFKNGLVYNQNPEDISIKDSSRSSFYDIAQEELNGNQLEKFSLRDGTNEYSINLDTGTFKINNAEFSLHNTEHSFFNKRLIYFRRNILNFNLNFNEIGKHIVYKIGWQGNDHQGNNVQYVLEIN